MPFCTNCGTQMDDNDKACGSCGTMTGGSSGKGGGDDASVSVMSILGTSLKFVLKKPFKLWGISLFHTFALICVSIYFVPFFWFPFMALLGCAVIFVLELGRISIFLNGYRGEEFDVSQLFAGFTKRFARNACGMGWMGLWTLIWFLVPLIGFITGIMKVYAYRFTPYILNNEPDIGATDVLKKSMQLTKGYRLKMFGADILINLGIFIISLIFIGLIAATASIPAVTFIFALIFALFALCVGALYPLFMGVVQAAFYDRITKD